MPKTTSSAEWLLACVAGPERATAILGDLTEMASTRGHLWFWTAYGRTLASLTWRIVLALFVADIGRQLMFSLANLYFHVTPPTWRTTQGPYLLNSMGPLLACVMSTLWFVLPFAAVRYGLRDRFVRLAFAVALGTTVAFLFIPWASVLFAAGTLMLAAGALLSDTWRKPLQALTVTAAAGILAISATSALAKQFRPQGWLERTLAQNALVLSLLSLAIVCSRLHHVFLRQPGDSALA